MNILYLCHRIPYPPNKGDKIRSYHQIQFLSRNHHVHLACLIDDPEDWKYIEPLRVLCKRVEAVERIRFKEWVRVGKAFVGGRPLSLGAFFVPELMYKVQDILSREAIDRIVIFSSPMAEYVKNISSIPKIIDFVDMDSEKWRAYAGMKPFPLSSLYQTEADRLGQYEWEEAQACAESLVISEEETHVLRERSQQMIVPKVVPNGVDYEYFFPLPPVDRTEPVIVFTAAMDYFPNVDGAIYFLEEIYPIILQSVPEAKFFIVGRNPDATLCRAASRFSRVTVTGTVPDVRPFLSEAMVAVAPLRIARGVQNKVLEAMAMELPVVGTSQAFLGLPLSREHGMYLANEPEEFAEAVIALLRDPANARTSGMAGRQCIMTQFDWSHILEEFEQILQEATV